MRAFFCVFRLQVILIGWVILTFCGSSWVFCIGNSLCIMVETGTCTCTPSGCVVSLSISLFFSLSCPPSFSFFFSLLSFVFCVYGCFACYVVYGCTHMSARCRQRPENGTACPGTGNCRQLLASIWWLGTRTTYSTLNFPDVFPASVPIPSLPRLTPFSNLSSLTTFLSDHSLFSFACSLLLVFPMKKNICNIHERQGYTMHLKMEHSCRCRFPPDITMVVDTYSYHFLLFYHGLLSSNG